MTIEEGAGTPSEGHSTDKIDYVAGADKKRLAKLGDALSRRWWFLEGEKLGAEARRHTGLEDFGDPELGGRLSVLTKHLESEANLHFLGRFLARMHLRDILTTRLSLVDTWKKSKPIDTELIERPVFITGMPRSGSTFLHELMVQDEDSRAPLVWEVMHPPLQPGETNEDKQLIRKTAASLWCFRRIAPGADANHPMRATTPQECVAIHSYALLSWEFLIIFNMSGYESFLNAADFTPAYLWQKRFLQHLQMQRPRKRWVLKAPDHIFNIDALFKVFPDAMVIQMHRDPIEVLQSSAQLGQVLRRTFAHPEDSSRLGARESRILAEGLKRITRFRDSHPELANRFLDVHYHQLVADPVGTVQRCYRQLDFPLTDATMERVRSLALQRSRYPHPRKRLGSVDFGIDAATEGRRFGNYRARFIIPQLGKVTIPG